MTLPYNAEGDPIAATPLGDTATPAREAPVQDVVPRGERNQDELRSEIAHDVTTFPSRPLTHDEKEAAEHDVPRGERVYAPASERVPKAPVPGHRDLVQHPDEATPERQAVSGAYDGTVHRSPTRRRGRVPFGSAAREEEDATSSQKLLGFSLAWIGLFVVGAVGMWLFLRWRRERNRPVNRLRRQAQWAADEIRERVPGSPDASTTAMGLAAALLSSGLVLWRRGRGSDDEDAEASDSQGWLNTLSSRIPRKVEAEAKFSVS